MNSSEFKDSVCRICLDEDDLYDWRNTVAGHSDVTYKDCYHKYTQIKSLDNDPFSCMLCKNCLQGLKNVHEFVLKAVDSYNFLLEVNGANCDDVLGDNEYILEEVESYDNTHEDDTVLDEKNDTASFAEDQFTNSSEEFYLTTMSEATMSPGQNVNTKIEITPVKYINNYTKIEIVKEYEKDEGSSNVNNTKVTTAIETIRRSKRNLNSSIKEENIELAKKKSRLDGEQSETEKVQSGQTNKNIRKPKRRYKVEHCSQNTPSMCSICSKILYNKYALQKHEKTHNENRERKVACPICGVKFFEQANVVTHMHIHDEKRVKKHLCEFCDKGFFTKGSLNVHRRIHLGQMIPCAICSKEFFRQVDLDIHTNKHHAAVSISGITKKRSRYLVQCPHCDKQVLSTNYKSHVAHHLNKPLAKCLICEKEFFSRDSCKDHLKIKHDKKSFEEYDPYILMYEKSRLSHLLLAQTTELIPTHK